MIKIRETVIVCAIGALQASCTPNREASGKVNISIGSDILNGVTVRVNNHNKQDICIPYPLLSSEFGFVSFYRKGVLPHSNKNSDVPDKFPEEGPYFIIGGGKTAVLPLDLRSINLASGKYSYNIYVTWRFCKEVISSGVFDIHTAPRVNLRGMVNYTSIN
jgi:hypothetical protein